VIISASIIYFFAPEDHLWSYWQLADPLCTYLFSFMAIYSTLPIVRESMLFLLDGCTDQQLIDQVTKELADNAAVENVESLRLWSTNRGKHYGALRVRVKVGKGNLEQLRRIFSSRGV
jgi:solute carrier family 30 (zinc transporter), member 2